MAISIPRGVQVVKWKNKHDKATVIKYRVRINRKDYKEDKLFNDLDEAINFLNLSKTKRGKEVIYSITDKEHKEIKAISDFIKEPSISVYIDIFVKDYLATRPNNTYLEIRNNKNILSFYKTIKNTMIDFRPENFNFGGLLGLGLSTIKKRFGDLKVSQITPIEINSYIKARLSLGIKKISISREITHLNRFFKKLRFISNQFKDLSNPIDKYDRDLLLNKMTKREFRLSNDEEIALFKALDNYSNPELKQIVLLSLLTAMRRSEIINLEWSQIKENYIQLTHTKSGRPRKVYLTLQAKELINSIEKKQDRLFKYSIQGFAGSFSKFLKTNKFTFHFHDLRRESISRFIEQIGSDNSILITEILGFANVKRFEENHISNSSLSVSNEKDLLNSIGHSNKQTTKIYTNLK